MGNEAPHDQLKDHQNPSPDIIVPEAANDLPVTSVDLHRYYNCVCQAECPVKIEKDGRRIAKFP